MSKTCACQSRGLLRKAQEGGVLVVGRWVRLTDQGLDVCCRDCGAVRHYTYGHGPTLVLRASRAQAEEG
jgi:RNase P subunit RPR2